MSDTLEDTDVTLSAEDLAGLEPQAESDGLETKVEPKEPVTDPTEALAALKKQLDDEKLARQADQQRAQDAERRAAEAQNSAQTAVGDKRASDIALVTNAMATVKQSNDIIKASLKDAWANGDFDAAAELQDRLSENHAKLMELERGKKQLEAMPKVEAKPVQADPAEALASQMAQSGFSRSAQWVREHADYARNPNLYRKMIAAHNIAEADGILADTDEYFDSIERTLGIRKPVVQTAEPEEEVMSSAAAPVRARSTPPPAAPPNRQANGARVIRLTAEQREMAGHMGMTEKEYALELERIQRERGLN